MNYISPVAYAETLNTLKGNYTNLHETEAEDVCTAASSHEWKKVGAEKAKCKHCGMVKTIAYGYEPQKSFVSGEKNKMREGKMSESQMKLQRLKQGLSPEDQEQLQEYLDSIVEIKKTIKELLLKGSRQHSDSHEMEEVGGDQMHKWMHETKKKKKK
jgi:hypothetical protein